MKKYGQLLFICVVLCFVLLFTACKSTPPEESIEETIELTEESAKSAKPIEPIKEPAKPTVTEFTLRFEGAPANKNLIFVQYKIEPLAKKVVDKIYYTGFKTDRTGKATLKCSFDPKYLLGYTILIDTNSDGLLSSEDIVYSGKPKMENPTAEDQAHYTYRYFPLLKEKSFSWVFTYESAEWREYTLPVLTVNLKSAPKNENVLLKIYAFNSVSVNADDIKEEKIFLGFVTDNSGNATLQGPFDPNYYVGYTIFIDMDKNGKLSDGDMVMNASNNAADNYQYWFWGQSKITTSFTETDTYKASGWHAYQE